MSILGLITPGIKAVDGLTKTVFGSRVGREEAVANESMAAHDQFAQEFRVVNRTWLDSLLDALNRMARPVIVGSVFYMFWLAYNDPSKFSVIMAALALIPDNMWTLLMVIVSFYIPSTAAAGAIMNISKQKMDKKTVEFIRTQAQEVIKMKKELDQEPIEDLPWLRENPAIVAWKKKVAPN